MEQVASALDPINGLLEAGKVLWERALPGSNCTYLVELAREGLGSCLAVYKPRDGEMPLWDFPPNTLYRREWLAYLVSHTLGWDFVPATVVREGPHGVGSVQRFIQSKPGSHYFNLMPAYRGPLLRVALFDCLVNNCDRKGGHCMLDGEGRVWAIDHGLAFSSGRKLRTVMWDFDGAPVPEDLARDIRALADDRALREQMAGCLSPQEVEAFYARTSLVLQSGTVPIEQLSDPHRPLPWPAV